MTLRPSSILVVVLFIAMFLAGALPRLRSRPTAVEVLPATSLQPSTAASHIILETPTQTFPGLETFATTVLNGRPNEVVGVYAPELFALPVMQQPKDQPAFVSSEQQILTQFALPSQYGATGLLAHNYLSGEVFYLLETGDEVAIIYGDGQARYFRVKQIERFQALNPNSPYSEFIDMEDSSSQVLSSAALFNKIYTTTGQVVFQTCIDANGEPSWGRLFVIAEPITELTPDAAAIETFINNN